jgi:hypothetical protein
MAGGELAAVFEGLAGDADQAAGNIAESVAKIGEQTADNEEANLVRTLDDEAQTAKSFTDIAEGGGTPADTAPTSTAPAGTGASAPADGSGTGGWSGAGHVSSASPEAEAAYAAIRANPGDVPKIAENTGIDPDVIGQVKNHLFMTEHDVPLGPNQIGHGYFTADEDIANLWNKAEEGSLSPAEQNQFRSLMSHEYVESRLMESGMPYRSADPEAWEDGTLMFNPSHFGAHEVAPLSSNGSLRLWPKLGLTPPDAPIAPDLSNIDDVVNAAREGLGL